MLKKMAFSIDDPMMDMKISELGELLGTLQRQLKDTDRSLLIVLSGWEATGKGQILNDLVREMDPRYFHLTQFADATEVDKKHPMLWRFFQSFPIHGQVGIFDHSYYRELMRHPDINDVDYMHAIRDITFLERLLTDDGCLIVKIFLDQSKEHMAHNIEEISNDENRRCMLSEFDHHQLKHYDKFRHHFERIVNNTSSLSCPWRIIEVGPDKKRTSQQVLVTIIHSLEWHLNTPAPSCTQPLPPTITRPLDLVDMTMAMAEEDYRNQLRPLQKQAADLLYQLYMHKIPTIAVFEGTDAAGKGGCIKRLTRLMDPRSYQVATTAAPTKFELFHHYLWRFYQTFPTPGHLTIYDRSWYGRVMVERIEGFTPVERWQEAYSEINDMEQSLVEDGYVILKFLLVIDKNEQLARFRERENTPEKTYKITDEDWRNHEKFDDYTDAMNDMIVRTSTIHAPWTIIPSMNKQYARIEVLKHFIEAATKALAKKGITIRLEKDANKALKEDTAVSTEKKKED